MAKEIEEMKINGNIDGLLAILQKKRDWMLSLDAAEALAQMGDQRGLDYIT